MQAPQPEPASADVLERACRSTAAVLEAVRSADLDRPTPCASWNVRDVVNHVVGGTGYFAELAEKGAVTDRGDDVDCTGADFAATFRREAERLVAAFRAPEAMTRRGPATLTLDPRRYPSRNRTYVACCRHAALDHPGYGLPHRR
jgi:uncharacterized protein (TIGR03086 family)